jgi:hypothetical protein
MLKKLGSIALEAMGLVSLRVQQPNHRRATLGQAIASLLGRDWDGAAKLISIARVR